MQEISVDVSVMRGTMVESRHRVHAAVIDSSRRLIAGAHDAECRSFWRSCAKPFQVMPLLESGGFDSLGWGDEELALACASHGGEPEHVTIAARMLASIGMSESDLACGAHDPLSVRGRAELLKIGGIPTRLHNNCSGKHSAMLARTRVEDWASADYHLASHPVQRDCLATVAEWCEAPAENVALAVDGCGVVVFGLTLREMATSYARLAEAARVHGSIASRIVNAMVRYPALVGGTGRFDTALMTATEGRVIAKVGAEGVHTIAVLPQGIGAAIKVEDGAERAQYPAVIALLQQLGALPSELPAALQPFAESAIYNTRGEVVGRVLVQQ